ncbi:alpha/beta hydrolase [Candidatus Woesearchaeota archaeon]|nr:alpha/beta hydrolase [Candidatus Woesearchaeota archaeon]
MVTIQLSTGPCSYYDSGGNKPLLMIIHGLILQIGYKPLVTLLEKHFRVIIPDLPFSTEEDFSKDHTIENYTGFLVEFVKTLKLGKVNLYGNSLGSTLALSCVLKEPKFFTRIVVRSPFYSKELLPFQFRNPLLVSLYRKLAYAPATREVVAKVFFRRMAHYFTYREKSRELYEQLILAQDRLDNKKTRDIIFDLLSLDLCQNLVEIRNEVLILWPDSDRLLNLKGAGRLHSLIKNSELYIEPNSHHCIATVDPRTLADHIIEFINK